MMESQVSADRTKGVWNKWWEDRRLGKREEVEKRMKTYTSRTPINTSNLNRVRRPRRSDSFLLAWLRRAQANAFPLSFLPFLPLRARKRASNLPDVYRSRLRAGSEVSTAWGQGKTGVERRAKGGMVVSWKEGERDELRWMGVGGGERMVSVDSERARAGISMRTGQQTRYANRVWESNGGNERMKRTCGRSPTHTVHPLLQSTPCSRSHSFVLLRPGFLPQASRPAPPFPFSPLGEIHQNSLREREVGRRLCW
jgi:hypothetical protein